ncbi:MAG: S-layer family protein [Cyanobacteria bacterium P01_B01_bin.77]
MRSIFFHLGVLISLNTLFLSTENALAQSNIVPDNTLGMNQSGVVPLDAAGLPLDVIDGGLNIGNNLFHSFLEFNVDENRGAYFRNDSNNLENILSRVTGTNSSDILGTLGIFNSPGTTTQPNLFFVNPNGILFGPNSSLDLPSAFIATTADAVELGENGFFSATQPESSQLLAVNPSALLFSQQPTGSITNMAIRGLPAAGFFINNQRSIPRTTLTDGTVLTIPWGLQVVDGKRLALIGGDIDLDQGFLTSVGGTIDIGSVAEAGRVPINLDTTDSFTTDYSEINQFGNINLSSSNINANGRQGGGINVQAARIFTDNNNFFSGISANTQGELGGREIFIRATEELFLDDAAIIAVIEPGATSNGGSIRIDSPRIFISGGNSSLLTRNFGTGRAGDIDITTGSLILREGAGILTSTLGPGDAGNLTVRASELVDAQGEGTFNGEDFAGGLQADIRGTGVGGTVTIDTRRLVLSDGAIVSARTNNGPGGSVDINAIESIDLLTDGDIRTQTFGSGNAGDIRIRTRRIRTGQGSEVTASAQFRSSGNAGDIEIIADELVEADGSGGYINAVLFGTGNGGNLTIQTPRLILRNGGNVSSEAITLGQAGDISIIADFIEVSGVDRNGFLSSQITASGTSLGDQALGSIDIQTRKLLISDGGRISVDTLVGNGPAGDLEIRASESIQVTGRAGILSDFRQDSGASRISATTIESSGGNITLVTPDLNISDQAKITVDSQDTGSAGNIEILGDVVSLDTEGQIVATSPSGNGGNLNLQLSNLLILRRGSSISTSAGTAAAGGDGGNIGIAVPFIVAISSENSDITANAFAGSGGQVNIVSRGLFGIEPRSELTPFSDITASSDQGVTGEVTVSSLDTSFIQNTLTDLPDVLTNPESLIASSCVARSRETGGTFTVIGSDLPQDFNNDRPIYTTGGVQTVNSSIAYQPSPSNAVLEPSGIYQTIDGRLVMSREC